MGWIVDIVLEGLIELLPRPVRRVITGLGAVLLAAVIGRALF